MKGRDILAKVSQVSDETEFYIPLPDGYELGQCRYVIVVGTVMSGLGKGIFSSSLAKLLKDKGFTIEQVFLRYFVFPKVLNIIITKNIVIPFLFFYKVFIEIRL